MHDIISSKAKINFFCNFFHFKARSFRNHSVRKKMTKKNVWGNHCETALKISLFWNIRDYSLCYKLHYALEYWREMALWRFVVMKRTQFGSRICSRWLWNRQHFRFRRFFGPHSWEQEEDWKSNCLNSHFLLIPNICA